MYDPQQYKELQSKSHVRGALAKQFFMEEEIQRQRKRKQLKMELDRQVQERRKQKQKQKLLEQAALKKQQQSIKNYFAEIQHRKKSDVLQRSKVQRQIAYDSDPQSLRSLQYNNSKSKANLTVGMKQKSNKQKPFKIAPGQIPVMAVMSADQTIYPQQQKNNPNTHYLYPHQQKYKNISSAGNIPVLELNQDWRMQNIGKQLQQSKRNKDKMKNQIVMNSNSQNPSKRSQLEQQYTIMNTHPDQQSLPGSRRNTQFKDQPITTFSPNSKNHFPHYQHVSPPHQVELENQNKMLKNELRKNQQAISLLIGAVRSNVRMDKFRIQAEKILHDNKKIDYKQEQSKKKRGDMNDILPVSFNEIESKNQKQFKLPRIELKHQSLLHDYIFNSAKEAHRQKSKNMINKLPERKQNKNKNREY